MPAKTVTIGQQVVETIPRRVAARQPYPTYIIDKKMKKYRNCGLSAGARLAIYLRMQLRYEKNCKSTRMMSLAGGEF
ncbi:hypothetical protein OIK40_06585 [Erythrobacter sp. sf7]|uniref:Uncharacterized protein n=1 Tax=Erythrobacter fulvus TaxID=2987523 RepID=A0ABT5JNX2_9SPHN|nr:hypothetical protein [Erythrobacter fulvus]